MKGRQILVEPRPDGGAAAALFIDGVLEDLLIDPEPRDRAPRPEAVHRAVVGRPMKGMGGAFVELGDGATGFLRGARLAPPGSRVLVQVSAWAEAGKAPPVADRIRLKGRLAVLTPGAPGLNVARSIDEGPERTSLAQTARDAMAGAPDDLGLIVRTAARADADALADEIAQLRAAWDVASAAVTAGPPALLVPAPGAAELARRDWPLRGDEPIDEHPEAMARAGVWEMAAELLHPSVALSAGSLVIEPTRALVAVDVNMGDGAAGSALQANLAAARVLPRQLRLRGLGGQIVVDFAPLSKVDRPRVEAALRAALRRDGVETTLAGWTPLGHLEILRKRARRPLTELPLR